MVRIGPITVDPPVVLAPMAGVTNRAFRRLCRNYGGALLVSEMVNARALVEGSRRSAPMTAFDDDETTRSIQIYGTDPQVIAEAVRVVVDRGAQHVDLNFGCPVRKVTRHGGGAAVPARPRLLAAIVAAAVDAAAASGPVPVTVKLRLGLDDDRLTFLTAGPVAVAEGAAAVALHARTAEQMYSGAARWSAIAELVAAVAPTPVLGNGDVWSADDALCMLATTGCAAVVVGRACLGRPWFFAELGAAFAGRAVPEPPRLGTVAGAIRDHARLLAELSGETYAALEIRKHVGWYLTGYPIGGSARRGLVQCSTLEELGARLSELDPAVALPRDAWHRPRGTRRGPYTVSVPAGWQDSTATAPPTHADAELAVSGG